MIEDCRETLTNEICNCLIGRAPDLQEIKNELYIILNDYEITNRCTEIAELKQDRNEWLLKKFLIAKKTKGCTERTIEHYYKTITYTLNGIGKTVDDITADDIRYYTAIRIRRDGITKTTAGNEQRCLSSFFTWLTAEECIRRNPFNKVDRIKKEKIKKKALTEMEIEKLRAAAVGEKEKLIIEVLLSTGCRVSELASIKIADIDNARILVHGKGEKDRYVYLNARAELTVDTYMSYRKDGNPYLLPRVKNIKEIDRKGTHIREYKDFWKNPENIKEGHIDKNTIEGITRNIAKRAGVEKANPHKFRRTCATMALRRGMPLEQVSKMLGHEDLSTTQIYLDLSEDELEQAHKKYVV